MRSYAAKMSQSVAATSQTAEASIRGDGIALFMNDMVNSGANAGIPVNFMHIGFDSAGSAAESASASSTINADVITAMKAIFRTGTQQRQEWAAMRGFSDSMPVMGATSAQTQQFTSANTVMQNAMLPAQENFEQMFASPTIFPNATIISNTESTMLNAMQAGFTTYLSSNSSGTAASNTDISTMQNTMASRMSGMGGMMGGMTGGTLAGMGVGMMVTTPGSTTTQNWSVMMVATNNFVVPTRTMTYTPMTTTLSNELIGMGITPPTPPTFTSFADPYKSMLELQYDLVLTKMINLQKLAQIGTTPTQAQMFSIKDTDLATKNTMRGSITGLTSSQATALMASLAQPEML
jgi:hypothetical protein